MKKLVTAKLSVISDNLNTLFEAEKLLRYNGFGVGFCEILKLYLKNT